jgi:hypothetical protein
MRIASIALVAALWIAGCDAGSAEKPDPRSPVLSPPQQLFVDTSSVNTEIWEKIQLGTTVQEVQKTLGTGRASTASEYTAISKQVPDADTWVTWEGEQFKFIGGFARNKLVVQATQLRN